MEAMLSSLTALPVEACSAIFVTKQKTFSRAGHLSPTNHPKNLTKHDLFSGKKQGPLNQEHLIC